MQVLFCHDGPILKDEQSKYYGVSFNDNMFKRYYYIADNLTLAIRSNDINSKLGGGYSELTIVPLEVQEVPNIMTPKGYIYKRKKAKNIIEKAVLKTDYIIARIPSITGFIAIDYARKHNKPYLTEVVTCPWDAYWNHSIQGKFVAPLMYLAMRKRVKESQYVIYVTNNFLQRRYPTKGQSVNCSNVALTEFNESVLEHRLKRIESLNEIDKIIIGTAAAVDVKFKGQQFIIEALGRLKEQGYDKFEYQILGNGDQNYLKSIAIKYNVINQVKFMGPLPHSMVFDWLDNIDIYTQPSRQEGLPRALIEAMSRAVPAFGANTAGIPELLEPEFLFSNSKKNIDEICEILKRYSKHLLEKQAQRNFKESKKYEKNIIENRRNHFFDNFKKNE